MSYPSRTAVPGGAVLPLAAVTRVGVRADRTRRGLATALMRAQLDDLRARGDALALLWAIESGIYGRYGYGVATRARTVRVRASREALRPQAPAGGTVRMLDRAEIVPVLSARARHARPAPARAGSPVPRAGGRATRTRHADDALLAAVHTDEDGTDDGFAVGVAGGPGPFGPDGGGYTLRVEDLHAAGAPAAAGLWRFLLGVDLVAHVEAAVPVDDPLDLLLADPRDAVVTGPADETWLRLVDVPTALAARSFRADVAPLLLAVHDPLLPEQRRGLPDRGGGRRARRSTGRLRAGAVVRRRRARAGLPRRPQPVHADRDGLVDGARPHRTGPGGRSSSPRRRRRGAVPTF